MTTIGQTLVSARTDAACSVQRLSEITCINVTVIRAMERDDFTPCGGDFYARGHLRAICKVLNIDAEPLLACFDANHADAPAQPKSVEEVLADTASEDSAVKAKGWRQRWALTAVVMVVAAMVAAGALIWANRDRPIVERTFPIAVRGAGDSAPHAGPRPAPVGAPPDRQVEEAEQRQDAPQAAAAEQEVREREVREREVREREVREREVREQEAREKEPQEQRGGEELSAAVALRVDVHEYTWASVYDGKGANLFTGVLSEGSNHGWTSPEGLRLHLGNAGGVRLHVNGADMGIPGGKGEVTRLTFSAEASGRD